MLTNDLNLINELFYYNSTAFKNIESINTELIQLFKNKSIKNFKQKDIEKYLKFLRSKNNKNTTINTKLSYLSKCLKYFKVKCVIPFQRVHKENKEIITYTTYIDLFLKTQEDKELQQFIQIAYFTGLRANEILNIKIQHIIKQSNDYFINIYNTKNHKDNLIPISNNLKDCLNNFQEFTMSYQQLHYKLNKYNVTAHQFRHTFITRCFESGLDSFTIMRLVNHTSLQTTKNYIHLQNNFLINEVNKIKLEQLQC